jgi:hypothetical protein
MKIKILGFFRLSKLVYRCILFLFIRKSSNVEFNDLLFIRKEFMDTDKLSIWIFFYWLQVTMVSYDLQRDYQDPEEPEAPFVEEPEAPFVPAPFVPEDLLEVHLDSDSDEETPLEWQRHHLEVCFLLDPLKSAHLILEACFLLNPLQSDRLSLEACYRIKPKNLDRWMYLDSAEFNLLTLERIYLHPPGDLNVKVLAPIGFISELNSISWRYSLESENLDLDATKVLFLLLEAFTEEKSEDDVFEKDVIQFRKQSLIIEFLEYKELRSQFEKMDDLFRRIEVLKTRFFI